MPQFKQVTLTLPDSTLPPLILTKSVEGGNWYKRSELGYATIGSRTIVGVPVLGGANRTYYRGEIVALVTEEQWTIFEEMKNTQRTRYDALEDGHIRLRDEYYYCTQSEATKNSRSIVDGSTIVTLVPGITKSYCEYPIYIEPSDDPLPYDGGGDWWPLSFSIQELP